MLAAVLRADAGTPALVHAPDGAAAYWLVPFVDGGLACGFARVELDGRVSQVGSFGAGERDRGAWPQAGVFEAPPSHMLEELERKHPEAAGQSPLLTYDRSPARWGWRIDLGRSGAAFLGPGGWYVVQRHRGDGGRN